MSAAVLSTPCQPEAVFLLLREMARDFGNVRVEARPGRAPDVHIECWVGGKRYHLRRARLTTGAWVRISGPVLAREILDSIRADIRGGTPPLQAIAAYLPHEAPDLLFRAAWEAFLEAKRTQRRRGGRQLSAKRLAELEGYDRRGYLNGLFDRLTHQIDPEILEAWADGLFARGLAPGSIHHIVANMGTCLRWLHRRRKVRAIPELPTVTVPEHQPRIPSEQAQAALLAAIPEELRGQYLARGHMGLRPSEAWRLAGADWDRGARTITVRGKGDRVRTLPLAPTVEAWLLAHGPERGSTLARVPLFTNPRGEASGWWSASASRRVWLAACRAVGVVFKENESLRHAFGTHLAADEDIDMERLSQAMGHTSPKTTRRYAKLGTRGVLHIMRRKRDA